MSEQKPKYTATERRWVKELLCKMTPTERAEYERRMKETEGHPNNGKKYDGLKAWVAERVMLEFRRRGGRP